MDNLYFKFYLLDRFLKTGRKIVHRKSSGFTNTSIIKVKKEIRDFLCVNKFSFHALNIDLFKDILKVVYLKS